MSLQGSASSNQNAPSTKKTKSFPGRLLEKILHPHKKGTSTHKTKKGGKTELTTTPSNNPSSTQTSSSPVPKLLLKETKTPTLQKHHHHKKKVEEKKPITSISQVQKPLAQADLQEKVELTPSVQQPANSSTTKSTTTFLTEHRVLEEMKKLPTSPRDEAKTLSPRKEKDKVQSPRHSGSEEKASMEKKLEQIVPGLRLTKHYAVTPMYQLNLQAGRDWVKFLEQTFDGIKNGVQSFSNDSIAPSKRRRVR